MIMSCGKGFLAAVLAALVLGCNVEPVGQPTGGIDLGGRGGAAAGSGGSAGAAAGAGSSPASGVEVAPCPRGLVVSNTDYQSSNVSLVNWAGEVLSESFISSASTSAGLSAPLSGDVTLPTDVVEGDEVVLLDRYPGSVLTWVHLGTAQVRAQLSVATGFAANPHDYVQVSPTKAYITRYEPNLASGQENFDQGNDILVVDPSQPAIVDRIDLMPVMAGEPADYMPRADRAVLSGEQLIVLAGSMHADFLTAVESRLAVIDTATDTLERVVPLPGLRGCAGLQSSPDNSAIAVVCSGELAGGSAPTLDDSGVVVLSLPELEEQYRYPAARFGESSIAFNVAWIDTSNLLLTTFGSFAKGNTPAVDDTLFQLDLESGEFEVLLRSQDTPFTIGELRCGWRPECSACFVTDASRHVLHRYEVQDGRLGASRAITVDSQVGLPPRYLGIY